MPLSPAEVSNIVYRQSVKRKIPTMKKVILIMLYIAVAIFTFLGTMWGTPPPVFC